MGHVSVHPHPLASQAVTRRAEQHLHRPDDGEGLCTLSPLKSASNIRASSPAAESLLQWTRKLARLHACSDRLNVVQDAYIAPPRLGPVVDMLDATLVLPACGQPSIAGHTTRKSSLCRALAPCAPAASRSTCPLINVSKFTALSSTQTPKRTPAAAPRTQSRATHAARSGPRACLPLRGVCVGRGRNF